jgi:hypothetical protein
MCATRAIDEVNREFNWCNQQDCAGEELQKREDINQDGG